MAKVEIDITDIQDKFKKDKFKVALLADDDLNRLASHYLTDGFGQMNSKERAWVLLTEQNSRSATKIAMVGSVLAVIAVILSLVQIVLALC